VRRIAWTLALAGAIPFAVATFALTSAHSQVRVPAIAAMVTYAAVILSFLGGIEWGVALREDTLGASAAARERFRAAALVVSAVPSLAAWGVLWLPSPHWQLGAALGLFLLVCAIDLAFARQGLLPSWFVNLRTAVTALVAVILGVALYLL
jgi:Protein of unknown function (DUF3429)